MTRSNPIHQPAIAVLEELGWRIVDCCDETFGPGGTLGRDTKGEVVLVERLRPALESLNPDATVEVLDAAIAELVRDRGAMDVVAANHEVHSLVIEGYRSGGRPGERDDEGAGGLVRYIDWMNPVANDFLFATGLGVTGDTRTCWCDLVGFVNGIPWVVVELKTAHKELEEAFGRTLADCERLVPRLFWYNAFSIISNGDESRVGPLAASWENYGVWSRVEREEEAPWATLESMLRGTCDRTRLLDLVECSLLFVEAVGGPAKIMAKNHQYLAVDAALESLRDLAVNEGRLGMFWHAPGNGKGVSMILFVQKVLRRLPGAWTFLVVTDRDELEHQAYGRLAAAGVVKAKVHADGLEVLGELLAGAERCVFARIQDFGAPVQDGQSPVVSERSDIVVVAEESHRPQYDVFASRMRAALPNAAFIGFTSTPLLAGEDNFRRVFGDYVSIYNFRESSEDGVTVPLYYESRLPEVQVSEGGLDRGLERLLREAEVDGAAEASLEREFGMRYDVITDDERLDTVARDIVRHFTGRGYLGKALVVSVDRITAVRMYEKVRGSWSLQMAGMRLQLGTSAGYETGEDPGGASAPDRRVAYWEETDMAALIAASVDDAERFRRKGVDVVPHVERAEREDLLARFNNPLDPLRLVFTCAEWISGIDTPPCSTIYLDKPMRDHVLLQTLGRANRRFRHKLNGLVVDYIGVFQDPRRALAAYCAGSGAGVTPGDLPVSPKSALLNDLRTVLAAADGFLRDAGLEPEAIRRAPGQTKLRLVDDAVDAVIATDARREEFLALARRLLQLYRAIVPDPLEEELGDDCALFGAMIRRIRGLVPEPGMSALERRLVLVVADMLDTQGYTSASAAGASVSSTTGGAGEFSPDDEQPFGPGVVDLAQIDLEEARRRFPRARKHIAIAQLRWGIETKLAQMVRFNPTRAALRDEYEGLVEDCETGRIDADAFFACLLDFVEKVNGEGVRASLEGLDEEELAVFDVLRGSGLMVDEAAGEQVKAIVRGLLEWLKTTQLAVGWREDRQGRAAVRSGVREAVERLPGTPAAALVALGSDLVFQHIYDTYGGGGRSVYERD